MNQGAESFKKIASLINFMHRITEFILENHRKSILVIKSLQNLIANRLSEFKAGRALPLFSSTTKERTLGSSPH
jgi:hypothetical protein